MMIDCGCRWTAGYRYLHLGQQLGTAAGLVWPEQRTCPRLPFVPRPRPDGHKTRGL